jgi:hypothetical protein
MRYLLLVSLACLLALAAAARAQGILFHASLKEGDTLRYDFKGEFSLARGEGKDPDRLAQAGRLRLTVASIDRDGNATVRLAFERLSASLHAGGNDWAYDPQGQAAEGESALATAYAELSTSILEVQVTPEGSVGEVSGLEATIKAARGAGIKQPERALGALSPQAIAWTLGPIFALDESGRERKAGESWTVGRDVELVHPYTARVDARYTLQSGVGGVAEVSGPITTTLNSARRPDAGPVLEIADQSGSITARWDAGALRLLSRTAQQRIAWKATLELKEPMTAASTTTSRVELKAVAEP